MRKIKDITVNNSFSSIKCTAIQTIVAMLADSEGLYGKRACVNLFIKGKDIWETIFWDNISACTCSGNRGSIVTPFWSMPIS